MMRYCVAIVSALFLCIGCAHTPLPPTGVHGELVVFLEPLDCDDCTEKAIESLKKTDGVHTVVFDEDNLKMAITYDSNHVKPDVLKTIVTAGDLKIQSVISDASKSTKIKFPSELDVKTISTQGEYVKLLDHLVPGKVTVFDFYADWCLPCQDIDREMILIMKKNPDVALRKLNIVDWDTPIVRYYFLNIPTIPYVIVYGKKGKLVQKIHGLNLNELRAAIKQGLSQ